MAAVRQLSPKAVCNEQSCWETNDLFTKNNEKQNQMARYIGYASHRYGLPSKYSHTEQSLPIYVYFVVLYLLKLKHFDIRLSKLLKSYPFFNLNLCQISADFFYTLRK